ncbi:hypothetical protein TRICI_004819 [Trichomonascus ciferrii]|uniref:Uncharacterized protein n=1 Tax=Trichomonascus ciferrii TaxID=44093 RepID=A0A642UZ47_9ASCO|nr:hypothetical protein TRICI_004819 [Trichomonascus ciferrii]
MMPGRITIHRSSKQLGGQTREAYKEMESARREHEKQGLDAMSMELIVTTVMTVQSCKHNIPNWEVCSIKGTDMKLFEELLRRRIRSLEECPQEKNMTWLSNFREAEPRGFGGVPPKNQV